MTITVNIIEPVAVFYTPNYRDCNPQSLRTASNRLFVPDNHWDWADHEDAMEYWRLHKT